MMKGLQVDDTSQCPSKPQWESAEGGVFVSDREMAVNKAAEGELLEAPQSLL